MSTIMTEPHVWHHALPLSCMLGMMTFWQMELRVPSVPNNCAVDGLSANVRRKLIPPLTSCAW